MDCKPLDHPFPERPRRLYFALTNHCNRACPWCSTCSSPKGNTWLSLDNYESTFPATGLFQVQLEGGEPTLHPNFWDFMHIARAHSRCAQIIICTNGVALPRPQDQLKSWVESLGTPLTIKLSINHYLLDHDKGLITLATNLRNIFVELGKERLFVINVRLRRGYNDDDRHVKNAVESAGLLPYSNIFFLQRYGFASNEESWELPAPVWDQFDLVNPDGTLYAQNLIARSEGMRALT
jgi:MoaA/NifB/PqqE/SkfB family radical SAM enzyme